MPKWGAITKHPDGSETPVLEAGTKSIAWHSDRATAQSIIDAFEPDDQKDMKIVDVEEWLRRRRATIS